MISSDRSSNNTNEREANEAASEAAFSQLRRMDRSCKITSINSCIFILLFPNAFCAFWFGYYDPLVNIVIISSPLLPLFWIKMNRMRERSIIPMNKHENGIDQGYLMMRGR